MLQKDQGWLQSGVCVLGLVGTALSSKKGPDPDAVLARVCHAGRRHGERPRDRSVLAGGFRCVRRQHPIQQCTIAPCAVSMYSML